MCELKCTEHCYEGDEYGRVRFLERQNKELREELREAKSLAHSYHEMLNNAEYAEKHPTTVYDWERYQPHRAYLLGKIARQAETIRNLQKVGWQPSFIIREVAHPDDADLWVEEKPVMSKRRMLKPPVIQVDASVM